MNISVIKTNVIQPSVQQLTDVLDEHILKLEENSVVAISSKIVSLCEGSVVRTKSATKDQLVKQNAQYYLNRSASKYYAMLTITHNTLIGSAGIDESNCADHYVLWPKNPLNDAKLIASYLRTTHNIQNVGVLIVDSISRPLRIGIIGTSIAHWGFNELNSYIGAKDIFGKTMHTSSVNVAECLATSAVFAMGEGAEQTPIAIMTEIENITFNSNLGNSCYIAPPTTVQDDVYAPMLLSVKWRKNDSKMI